MGESAFDVLEAAERNVAEMLDAYLGGSVDAVNAANDVIAKLVLGGFDIVRHAPPLPATAAEGLDVVRLTKATRVIAVEDRDRVLAGDYRADTYSEHAARLAAAYLAASEPPAREETP